MREYKFRGKRVDNGEWVYGNLVKSNEEMVVIIPWLSFMNGCSDCGAPAMDCCDVDPATVGQFTGLCDKNGKEIYENDKVNGGYERAFIVKYSDHFHRWQLVPLNEVAKRFHSFEIPIFDWVYPEMCLDVIHDNPELLQGEGER